MKTRLEAGDCRALIPTLRKKSVTATITSPPYADQRHGIYPGIAESDYPAFTVEWMAKLRPKLTETANVLIVIRAHLRHGQISDYILRTRLALRDDGWREPEELVWLKPDAPPLGSTTRPRRTFEQILWFSMAKEPFIDLKACGKATNRLGFIGRKTAKVIHGGQRSQLKSGTARVTDTFTAYIATNAKDKRHPAVYPQTLTDQLVATFSPVGGLVLDPFVGSGTTAVSALALARPFVGFDAMPEYVAMTRERVALAATA